MPKDRDAKRLDLPAQKNHTSSLQMRIINQQALLYKYDFLNLSAMSKFNNHLLKASHEEFWAFTVEDCLVARTSLQSTLNVVDSLARVMASAEPMRMASWLQNPGIALDIQQTIEDLPFDS